MKSFLPTNPGDQFRLALAALHATGAVGAALMSLICGNVARAVQTAMTPYAMSVNAASNLTAAHLLRTAYPWTEDRQFTLNRWNPYILVVAFEWLTAGFAVCNIKHWLTPNDAMTFVQVWNAAGAVLIGVWFALPSTRQEPFCAMMAVILTVSFVAAAVVFSRFLKEIAVQSADMMPTDPADASADGRDTQDGGPQDSDQDEPYTVIMPPNNPDDGDNNDYNRRFGQNDANKAQHAPNPRMTW